MAQAPGAAHLRDFRSLMGRVAAATMRSRLEAAARAPGDPRKRLHGVRWQ